MLQSSLRSLLGAAALGLLGVASAVDLTVATSGGNASSPLLYGLLYEDVYHSGDGGIYAEMIQNRAFQGSTQNGQASTVRDLHYWHNTQYVYLQLDNSAPALSEALPYQMRAEVASGANGIVDFWNEGYEGFNITTTTRYAFSFYLRGTYDGTMGATFWSNTTGQPLGSTSYSVSQTDADGWKLYQSTFMMDEAAPDLKNTFHLSFDGGQVAGKSLYFQMLSAFQQTFKDGKLRMDLANAVNNIGGKFLRMPGGNNMEGPSSPFRWQWDKTIGPITDRPGRPGTWGYYNTDGLGLLEMMQWCIDMNLETILAVWGGLFLNGQIIAQSDLQPYVDDVMNELEFLLGSSSTTYGAMRASLGYPNPFTIRYVEVGNEDYLNGGTDSYAAYRFNMFYNAIKAKYPNMIVISTLQIDQLQNATSGVAADLHLYQSNSQTVALFNAFDNSPREYPLLVGEYAAIYANDGDANQLDNPTLQSATAEGVMFLGLERNSDVIIGSSHGALMKSLNDEPDNVAMIKHNADSIVPSMSYYVAQLFATHHGTHTRATTSTTPYGPLYWSTTVGDDGTYFVKIVNYNGAASTPVNVHCPGKTAATAQLITVSAASPDSVNGLGSMQTILSETTVTGSNGAYSFTLTGSYISAVLVV